MESLEVDFCYFAMIYLHFSNTDGQNEEGKKQQQKIKNLCMTFEWFIKSISDIWLDIELNDSRKWERINNSAK